MIFIHWLLASNLKKILDDNIDILINTLIYTYVYVRIIHKPIQSLPIVYELNIIGHITLCIIAILFTIQYISACSGGREEAERVREQKVSRLGHSGKR